jgi:hypothetical protein
MGRGLINWRIAALTRRPYAVLARLSSGYPPPEGRLPYVLRTRSPLDSRSCPLDLHVLSHPLAFALSQDQTLHLILHDAACASPWSLIYIFMFGPDPALKGSSTDLFFHYLHFKDQRAAHDESCLQLVPLSALSLGQRVSRGRSGQPLKPSAFNALLKRPQAWAQTFFRRRRSCRSNLRKVHPAPAQPPRGHAAPRAP